MTAFSQSQTTLALLRDTARPLLIFAGAHDSDVAQQLAKLVGHREEAKERDLKIVLLTHSGAKPQDARLPPQAFFGREEQTALRKRFHIQPDTFTAILIGKDGGEKLRSCEPVAWQTLAATIDTMPMRRREMSHR